MILADENIATQFVAKLRADGIDVASVAELAPGSSDSDVLAMAEREGRILLTDDKDFGELAIREGRSHHGVILLRLAGMPFDRRAEILSRLIQGSMDELRGAFTVIDGRGRIRSRRSRV